MFFLATLVALHFTPVSESLAGQSFGLAQLRGLRACFYTSAACGACDKYEVCSIFTSIAVTAFDTGIRALESFIYQHRIKLETFSHVVELNMLTRTRQRVTRRTILAGTMSGGTKKATQDMVTNMAEGRQMERMKGPRERESCISNPYTEQLPAKKASYVFLN